MLATARPRSLGFAGASATIASIGGVIAAAGLAVVALRFFGRSPAEDGIEAWSGALALGAVVAAPGVLALLALSDRPALLLPAATVLIPVSFLSFAGVLLPLLFPAVLLFIAYGRRSAVQPAGGLRTAATLAWVQVLLVAAGAALFVHQDPRSYSTPIEEGSTSDVITAVEALVSLGLVVAAIVGGWSAGRDELSARGHEAVQSCRWRRASSSCARSSRRPAGLVGSATRSAC